MPAHEIETQRNYNQEMGLLNVLLFLRKKTFLINHIEYHTKTIWLLHQQEFQ